MSFNLVLGLHILAVIAWMAGLLYLPRLFVYHVKAIPGGELDTTLQVMERRLFRGIMNPAMVAVILFGAGLVWYRSDHFRNWTYFEAPWAVAKLAGIVFLVWWHHVLGRARKRFAAGTNTRSEKYWRMTNELPFVAAILIVLAVTTKFA